MKFPFLTAEIKAHLQCLFQRHLVGGRSRGLTVAPESGDAHRRGMPAEPLGAADRGFLKGIFEELTDRHRFGVAFPGNWF